MKRKTVLVPALLSACVLVLTPLAPWSPKLVWNRTQSAPTGLYFVERAEPGSGDWAALSGDSAASNWAAERGYIGQGWPVIKRVRAVSGDEICRLGTEISVNGVVLAEALTEDLEGRPLPVWQGCRRLGEDEIFLLNDHPRSLDGRYFGATRRRELLGRAICLWPEC